MFPKDGRFKFDIDPCIHGGDPLDQKLRTDVQTAFQLYIVDYVAFKKDIKYTLFP